MIIHLVIEYQLLLKDVPNIVISVLIASFLVIIEKMLIIIERIRNMKVTCRYNIGLVLVIGIGYRYISKVIIGLLVISALLHTSTCT